MKTNCFVFFDKTVLESSDSIPSSLKLSTIQTLRASTRLIAQFVYLYSNLLYTLHHLKLKHCNPMSQNYILNKYYMYIQHIYSLSKFAFYLCLVSKINSKLILILKVINISNLKIPQTPFCFSCLYIYIPSLIQNIKILPLATSTTTSSQSFRLITRDMILKLSYENLTTNGFGRFIRIHDNMLFMVYYSLCCYLLWVSLCQFL